MGFSQKVKDEVLVASGRHCCLCHKFCGLKIELHHIVQRAEKGEDTFENCIPLCFECHADMRSYDHKHPKGTKYTPTELVRHRDNWYKKVKGSPVVIYGEASGELDRAVMQGIKEALPYTPFIRFLETHTFANPFRLATFESLDNFLQSSDDPSKEFIDADLEGLRAKLVSKSYTFRNYLCTNTWPLGKLQSVPPEWQDTQWERFKEVVDQLNTMSTDVAQAYADLIREARRKLGV